MSFRLTSTALARVDRRFWILLGCAVGLASVTSDRVAQWQTNTAIWEDAARVTPQNPQVFFMLAVLAFGHDRPHATSNIDRAVELVTAPTRPDRSPLRTLIWRWYYAIHGSAFSASQS